MFPPELITMGVSTAIGAVMRIWTNIREDRHQEFLQLMESNRLQANIYKEAREFQGSWSFEWTRRTIAILGVLAIIVWPKIVPVFWPDVPVVVFTPIYDKGFWWWNETLQASEWDWQYGAIFITPLDTNLIAAVIGLFFGSEITKRR